MASFNAVQPVTEQRRDVDETTDRARQRAIELAQAGLPLSAQEFALIRRLSISRFNRLERRGAFEDFLLRPAFGPRRYSGVLVARWLRGEVVDAAVATRTFGRKRA